MAIGGKFRRGQSLVGEQKSKHDVLDYESERAKLRELKRKNQRRGVMLSGLLLILVIAVLIGAWYVDKIIREDTLSSEIVDNMTESKITCEFYDIVVEKFSEMTAKSQQFVCDLIYERDILSGSELSILTIKTPTGFAHAVDIGVGDIAYGKIYRLLVDNDSAAQLEAMKATEQILHEKGLHTELVDLRVEGRAVIK